MTDQGLPEPQFSYDGMFIVKLTRPVEFEKWIKRWASILSDTQISILRNMKDDPTITITQLSKLLGSANSTINYNLKTLNEKGLIQRVGSLKAGHWQINYITL